MTSPNSAGDDFDGLLALAAAGLAAVGFFAVKGQVQKQVRSREASRRRAASAQLTEQGHARLAANDVGGAVQAWNAALAQNPANAVAANGVATQLPEDLGELIAELSRLGVALRAQATTPAQLRATAEVAEVQAAAEQNQRTSVMDHLRQAGRWAMDIAGQIGVSVAQSAISGALGLPS